MKSARVGKKWALLHDPTMEQPLTWANGKGTEKLTRSFMSAPMFASTECPSTELTFVLFIRNVLRLRRFGHGCDRRSGSCSSSSSSRHCNTMESSTRILRVKRIGLSDTGASMRMEWAYAKRNSFDHAFWCSKNSRRRRKLAGGKRSEMVVLAASLILWSLVGFFILPASTLVLFLFFLMLFELLYILRR